VSLSTKGIWPPVGMVVAGVMGEEGGEERAVSMACYIGSDETDDWMDCC
jgi:hypothetical protein